MPGSRSEAIRAEEVVSAADPRLSPYRDLKDSALRRRAEAEGGYFVVEGRLALEAALSSSYRLVSVLVLRRRLRLLEGLPLPPETTVYVAHDEVMRAVTGFDVHRGLLAVARRKPPAQAESLLEGAALAVVVEGVNDQENLGAIFRNARAFGASPVLLDPTCSDPLYRRSVRVSLGHVLHVPFARLEPWPSALQLVQESGLVLVALTPQRSAEPVQVAAGELYGQRVALLVGAEARGLSAGVLARALKRVRVPMAPGVDSLNVATALAIALHRFSSGP